VFLLSLVDVNYAKLIKIMKDRDFPTSTSNGCSVLSQILSA